MADLSGFNANEVEPSKEFDVIPSGKYLAVITESEMKTTKNGNGQYLELVFQIVEGEYKGRNQWARLNLDNPNPTAVRIAKGELSSICRAVGVMIPKESSELHNKPLTITVKQKVRTDNKEMANEIRGFAPADKATGPTQEATPKAQESAAGTTAPWLK